MHDRFRILTLKRPLPERSEAKEIFLVPTDAAQNPIIGPDLSEPSAYLPSREALQAHPSPNVCKNDFVGHVPVHPNMNLVLFQHVFFRVAGFVQVTSSRYYLLLRSFASLRMTR